MTNSGCKIVAFLLFVLFSCSDDSSKPNISEKSNIAKKDHIEIPYFWAHYLCEEPDFSDSFYCSKDTVEFYQVQLSNDLRKKTLLFYIKFHNNNISSVKYMSLYQINKRKKNPKERIIAMAMPYNKTDTMYCNYNAPITISTNRFSDDFRIFLTKSIWDMPETDKEGSDLDPEVWSIIGRKNGVERQWMRQSFNDPTFYSNIQLLLNAAKTTEYKYTN